MDTSFARAWKQVVLRGSLALLFAGALLLWRRVPFPSLVLVFGAYALLDGAIALAFAGTMQSRRPAWLHVLEGLVGVGLGANALLRPPAAAALLYVVALWAMTAGLLKVRTLLAAIVDRTETRDELLLAAGGAVSVLIGFCFLFRPTAKELLFVVLLGPYAAAIAWTFLRIGLGLLNVARHSGRPDAHH